MKSCLKECPSSKNNHHPLIMKKSLFLLFLLLSKYVYAEEIEVTITDTESFPLELDFTGDNYSSGLSVEYLFDLSGAENITFTVSCDIIGQDYDGLEIYDIDGDGNKTLVLMVGIEEPSDSDVEYNPEEFEQYYDGKFNGVVKTVSTSGKAHLIFSVFSSEQTTAGAMITCNTETSIETINTIPGVFSYTGDDYSNFLQKQYLIDTEQNEVIFFTCNVNIDDDTYDYFEIYQYDEYDNESLLLSTGKTDNVDKTTLNFSKQVKTAYPTGKAKIVFGTDGTGSNKDWETENEHGSPWGGFEVFYSTKPALMYAHDLAGNRILRTLATITLSSKSATISGGKKELIEDETYKEQFDELNIKIYPNPVDHLLKVLIENSSEGADCTYRLFDSQGKFLESGILYDQLLENISFASYPQGSYILQIRSSGKDHPFQIIKE